MSGSDFWSRRKAAVAAEDRAQEVAAQETDIALREAALEERTDEDLLAELELPDPDTLEAGDDFKAFLAKTVPARIRTRALRRLWVTNPVLANVDGLVDYGGDFTDASCVLEKLQTAYQVGKGMTKHVEELARQAEAVASEDTPHVSDPAPVETENAPAPVPETPPVGLAVAQPETPPVALTVADEVRDEDTEEPAPAPVPRRMRFSFEDAGEDADQTERTERV
jgi:hypothetical protein